MIRAGTGDAGTVDAGTVRAGTARARPSRPALRAVYLAALVASLATVAAGTQFVGSLVARKAAKSGDVFVLITGVLVAVSLFAWTFRRSTQTGRGHAAAFEVKLAVLVGAMSSSALLAGGSDGVALLPLYLLLLAQVATVVRAGRSAREAAQSLVASLGLVLVAVSVSAGAVTLLLLPVGLSACCAAAALLHADVARPPVVRSPYALSVESDDRAGIAGRVLSGISLGALGLLALLVLYPLVARAPWRTFGDPAERDRRPALRRGARANPNSRARRPGESEMSISAEPSLSFDIGSEDLPVPTDEVLLEVKASVAGRPVNNLGSLHLRGMVRAAFASEAERERELLELPTHIDEADGWKDGWTVLATNESGADPVELHVVQYPLRIEPLGWNLLFHPVPLYAVSFPSVRHDPDRMCVTTDLHDEWFEYRLHARRPTAPWPGIADAVARHPEGRFTDLPPPSYELDRISDLALEITANARSDLQRVRAIENHYWTNFEYTIEGTDAAGLAGIVEFLERGQGYCTYYATATVVMLRTLGIPARIASGFLATDWSTEREAYVVRSKDRHDWVEVYYEDLGWVTYDPTPPLRREAALARAMEAQQPGVGDWARQLVARLGEEDATLKVLAEELGVAPSALVRSIRRNPAIAIGLLLLIGLLVAVRLFAGRAAAPKRTRTQSERAADAFYGRLLTTLRRHGFRKPRSLTPREFAEAVVREGGSDLEPARTLTEVYYASRYGGHPIATHHRERLAEFASQAAR